MSGDRASVAADEDVPFVSAQPADVARGLLLRRDAGDARDWAMVLLAADFIDLGPLESVTHGPELLEAIWDVAGGVELKPKRLRVVQDLAST